jgi:hypothetical protein
MHRLADEYKGHTLAVGRPMNIWAHLLDPRPGPRPSIFISDVSPMNVTRYISWFHITNE